MNETEGSISDETDQTHHSKVGYITEITTKHVNCFNTAVLKSLEICLEINVSRLRTRKEKDTNY